MKGEGWKLRVHENLGWHYCVFNRAMSVHEYNPGTYFTLLSGKDSEHYGAGGLAVWSDDNKPYTDPNEAVLNQLILANDHIKKLVAAVSAVTNRIEGGE